jgi:hypothetical protein
MPHLDDSEKSQFSLACLACSAATTTIGDFLANRKSGFNALAKIACYIALKEKDVCFGTIDLMTDPVMDNLAKKLRNKDYMCGLIGKFCPTTYKYEDFDNYTKTKLAGKPAKKESKPTGKSNFKIITISDIHIEFLYQEGYSINCTGNEGDCCNPTGGLPKNADDASLYWGSPGSDCDLPPHTLDAAVTWIKENLKPDLIILNGDYTDHRIWDESRQRQNSFREYVSKALQPLVDLGIPIYSTLGNHELLPVDVFDLYDGKNDYLLQESAASMKNLLPADGLEQFKKTGCYTTMIRPN